MTRGQSARGVHAWQRNARRWDLYYGTVLAATEFFLCMSGGPHLTERLAAAGLLLMMFPLYLLVGRPTMHGDPEDSPRAMVYIWTACLLFAPAAVFNQEATIMMFALGPQCFMLLSIRRAMLTLVVVNLAPLVAWGFLWHDEFQRLLQVGVLTLLITAFSVVFGGWVQRIVDQSRDRAELIRQLDETRDEVARLSAAHGALSERERLAREIHDTLAQGFTSLVMLSQAVESELDHDLEQARRHVQLIGSTARENLAESRALVAALAPANLDSVSLEEAVRRLVERLAEELGVRATVQADGVPAGMPPATEVVALRTCQEALANIRKHAHATEVTVALARTPEGLALTVADDGRGFDPAAVTGGYGLPGMRARAAEIGGTAEVWSAPGEGTVLTVRLPVVPAASDPDPAPDPASGTAPAPGTGTGATAPPAAVPSPRDAPSPAPAPAIPTHRTDLETA